jgi:hypothetical protein
LEIRLGFTGKADDKAGTDRDIGRDAAPVADALKHLGFVGRPLHRLQHRRRGMLERDVEIGRQQPSAINGMTSSTCG